MMYVFYIFSFLFIFAELTIITYAKDSKNKTLDKDVQQFMGCMLIIYFIWLAIGLFTVNWIIFLILILAMFIPGKGIFIVNLGSVLRILILLFLIINKFHLHIDIFELVKNLF